MILFRKAATAALFLMLIQAHAAGNVIRVAYNNNFLTLPASYVPQEKPYTIIIYMAADNDLRAFSYRNLEEIKYLLRATPATENFNIFIQPNLYTRN